MKQQTQNPKMHIKKNRSQANVPGSYITAETILARQEGHTKETGNSWKITGILVTTVGWVAMIVVVFVVA